MHNISQTVLDTVIIFIDYSDNSARRQNYYRSLILHRNELWMSVIKCKLE